MVHAGPAARAPSRAMFAAAETKPRRAVSPLGIPKSPSFHSGLDLVANQTTKRSESVSDVARAFRFALFGDGSGPDSGMEGQGPPQQKVPSPPGARSPPPPPPTAPAPVAGAPLSDRPPLLNDKESLMVQLPLLKGSSPSVAPNLASTLCGNTLHLLVCLTNDKSLIVNSLLKQAMPLRQPSTYVYISYIIYKSRLVKYIGNHVQ